MALFTLKRTTVPLDSQMITFMNIRIAIVYYKMKSFNL